ncbi:MAG: Sapep family Mn(2+)-dependent dipeptidase [Eubacteriales bacterium]|nr:Sapep family Mn(2+)-dependent dipeptidase [Eubacteriales bacterium]
MGYLDKAKSAGIDTVIENYRAQMLEKLAELVAIPSLPTYTTQEGLPLGPEIIRALHYALELSEKLGFKTHNENDKYGWAEVGEEGPLVCIFVHLDIVPVGDGWTRDPFTVSEKDGWLYGRGILDNKGPAIACLYALKACCDMGTEWPCRVRIWFGTNEETGMNDIQMYIHDYGAPDISFVPDSQFPLSYSELGTTNFLIRKNYRPDKISENSPLRLVRFETKKHANGITPLAHVVLKAGTESFAEEVCRKVESFAQERKFEMSAVRSGCDITVESRGKVAAHWNEPWTAINALAQIVLFLDTVSVGEEPDSLIHFVATRIGNETDGASLGIKAVTETAELSVAIEEVYLDECGLAFHFFMISPAELRVEILLDTILRQLRTENMELIVKSFGPAMLLDKDMPLIKVLYDSYSEVTGNTDPIKVCGGTYSKFIPNAVPFGAIFSAEKDICHVPDEKIEISDLINWTKIYSNALLRIADNLEILK